MLINFLKGIKDHRRKKSSIYELHHVLFCSILAILSGATSYRKIHTYIKEKYEMLSKELDFSWPRIPAYTTIRDIIHKTESSLLEEAFRSHSQSLKNNNEKKCYIAVDGKVLRGSFDHFIDQKAIQLFSFFDMDEQLIIAHEQIEDKTNEIPVFEELMQNLDLSNNIYTADAMHCQKNARSC